MFHVAVNITYLSANKMMTAMIIRTAKHIMASKNLPLAAPPIIGANIPKPNAPAANCFPTSPRPAIEALIELDN